MRTRPRGALIIASLLLLTLVPTHRDSIACSRVLWNDGNGGILVGRNLDWPNPMPVDLYLLPRGLARDGLTGKNSLAWTAKYGSVVVGTQGGGSDGVNEKGLAGHMLWLTAADYGTLDHEKPSLAASLWLQYYLDNFATVRELVDSTNMHPFQIVACTYDGLKTTVHLALEDAMGDSAVIEYCDGRPRIYHGRKYTVMTNDPPYDEQLRRLADYRGFGGECPLPGTTQAADRFVRAAYFLKGLPRPRSDREAVAEILSVMRNVAQPYSVTDARAMAEGRPHNSVTRWRTVADLTRGLYFFESSTSPNIIWVKLAELSFAPGSPVRKLDMIGNPDRVGDCSAQFAPAQPFMVLRPDQP